MSRPTLLTLLCAAALLGASIAHATITNFTWTGKGGNPYTNTPGNWSTNIAPTLTGGLENLIFPNQGSSFTTFSSNSDVYGLNLTGFHSLGGAVFLHLYGGGLTFSSSYQTRLDFGNNLAVDAATDQTWNIGSNTTAQFFNNAYLTGTGKITKTGAGTLDLDSNNSSWTGGLQFNEGTVILRPGNYGTNTNESRSLGTGTVTVGPDTANRPVFEVYDWSNSGSSNGDVVLTNNFILNGIFASKNDTSLELRGNVTLNADTTFRTVGDTTMIHGDVNESGGARKLTVDSADAIVLSGANNWTGGTDVTKGVLIFAGDYNGVSYDPNLPVSGSILVGPQGYAGISVDNSIASFMSKINPASTGSIGFDSDPSASPSNFNTTTTIDLSGFNSSLRLGSATHAILGSNVTITPGGTTYRFGGGGGWLQVDPELTSGRTVALDSLAELPLTVRFTNSANAFSGVTVTNSGAVFAPGALPAGASLTVNAGAYLGSEDPNVSTDATATNAYLARFGTGTAGIIGFDIDQFAASPATRIVDLTGVNIGSLTGGGYLGTASALFTNGQVSGPGVKLTGTIAPSADNIHRFAAYKGGALEVVGTLTGTSMIIGQADSLGAFGDRTREEYSTVLVSGNNTGGLIGGTTFYGGRLMVGQAAGDGTLAVDHTHALGEGILTIAPSTFTLEEIHGAETPTALLAAYASNLIIGNSIVINAPELNLGGDNNFSLTGAISGTGGLNLGDDSNSGFRVNLSGNNTFSGGVHISNGAKITANSDTAFGAGTLAFENGNGNAYFSTAAPVIYGLESNSSGTEIELLNSASARLRIIQNSNSIYQGNLRADNGNYTLATDGVFVKEGTGTLRLQNSYVYGYGQGANRNVLEVKAGTLVLDNVGFENSTVSVKVNGGTLALDNNTTMNSRLDLVSGRLAGNGTFANTSPIPTIGTGLILSPGITGQNPIGKLQFYELSLAAGGSYEWNLQSFGNASFAAFDQINVTMPSTLDLNSIDIQTPTAAANRFTLKAISLQSDGSLGVATGFNPSQQYTWTVFTSNSLTGFDPNKLLLDVTQFSTNLGSGLAAGTFYFSQNGNNIVLNFTAVPEPSTYALLVLGLGFIGLIFWRQRRV